MRSILTVAFALVACGHSGLPSSSDYAGKCATPRHGTGGAVVGNAIYIPAGGPVNGGSQQSTANEAFTLA